MRLAATRLAVTVALLTSLSSAASAQQQQHGAQKQDSAGMKGKGMQGHDMQGHDMQGHAASPWKEMDAFHTTLAATYHPAADKGDFAPLKARAAELAAKAKTWAATSAPPACSKPDTKATVDALASASATLAEQVRKGASNDQLKAAVGAIHEKFETVEHGCAPVKR